MTSTQPARTTGTFGLRLLKTLDCRDLSAAAALAGLLLLLTTVSAFASTEDFDAGLQAASAKLEKLLPVYSKQMEAGDFSGANQKMLAVFPPATRTAAESFALGNALFDADATESYALHKAAAAAEPGNATVVWEWGLEQHRAREYAGALKSYQFFSGVRPRSASPYALQADCLLRLNRVDDAIDAWRKSEKAPVGSIEAMEDLVCTVHRDPAPHKRRAELLATATKKQDVEAGCDLIALDCDFPGDWWNSGPCEPYLNHDGPAVAAALKLPADHPLRRALQCAAECATADHNDPAAIRQMLTAHRLLIDADQTIPAHGGLLSVIMTAVVEAKAIDDNTLRNKIGPKLLEMARKGRDERQWNMAAFAALTGPPGIPTDQITFEREGWRATGDARFAAGVLFLKEQAGQLKGDDPDLAAALKQFPESGLVQRAAYEVARRENKITRELLAAGARAEFTHFTSFVAPATVVNRPRSGYLRQYFALMLRLPATTKPGRQ